jgi:hypothetical protein
LKTRTTAIKLTRLLHELYSLARTKKNYDLSKCLRKNIDLIYAKLPAEKKTNFTLTKTIVEAKKYYRLTEMLAKKM